MLSERLNNPDLPVLLKTAVDEVVEPRPWDFPISLTREPNRSITSIVLKPIAIVGAVGKPKPVLLTFLGPANDHRS